jgi:pyridoxal phosphate enzyme (YggS family)
MTSLTSAAMTIYPASFASDELLERVGANLNRINQRIATSGRSLDAIRVVAVTKTFGAPEVVAASTHGLTTFGENYVDELCAKREATSSLNARWHFLGTLQSNKIARVGSCADVLSTVARVKELIKISALFPGKSIDVQVDFTSDAQRNGVAPGEVGHVVAQARDAGLYVRGLMVVAPKGERETREAFAATVRLADELQILERSMGMSDDLELACEMGTTEVRLGRALFGSRVVEGHLT